MKDWEQLQIRAFSKMRYASNTGSARRRSGGMRTMVTMVAALQCTLQLHEGHQIQQTIYLKHLETSLFRSASPCFLSKSSV